MRWDLRTLRMKGTQGLEIGPSVEKAALQEHTDSSQRPCQMTPSCLTPQSTGSNTAGHPRSHLHLRAHTHMESHVNIRENKSLKLKDGLVVQSSCCSCRRCRFNSQNPHGSLTTLCSSTSRDPVPPFEFHWHQECTWCT